MLGWRWRGFCNTYSMTMLHFVPFTSIDGSSVVRLKSLSVDRPHELERLDGDGPHLPDDWS